MSSKYPYHRVTGTINGKSLSYEDCLTYIEEFGFIEKQIPVAIVYSRNPPHGWSKYSVWAWRKEPAPSYLANIEKIPDDMEIKASFNGFDSLYFRFIK